MQTQIEKERAISNIILSASESLTLEELGSKVLPKVEGLFNTSTSLFYRCSEQGELVAIAGPLTEAHNYYAQHYYSIDPLQPVMRRLNLKILHAPSLPGWKEYLEHPSHTYCATHQGCDNFVHLRLNDYDMHTPGMVGMLLARTHRQPDFGEDERATLGRLLPVLEALVRRSARLNEGTKSQLFLESMLEGGTRPKLALDPRGGLLWASERASILLGWTPHGRKTVPDALVGAVRHFGSLFDRRNTICFPPSAVSFPGKDQTPIHAELRLARTRTGAYFIVVELEDPGISPLVEELKARYFLTSAETQVLRLMAQGLSDQEIGKRLYISRETVHTHAGRIFSKLGVRSRVQAALLAHGQKIESDSEVTQKPQPHKKNYQ